MHTSDLHNHLTTGVKLGPHLTDEKTEGRRGYRTCHSHTSGKGQLPPPGHGPTHPLKPATGHPHGAQLRAPAVRCVHMGGWGRRGHPPDKQALEERSQCCLLSTSPPFPVSFSTTHTFISPLLSSRSPSSGSTCLERPSAASHDVLAYSGWDSRWGSAHAEQGPETTHRGNWGE